MLGIYNPEIPVQLAAPISVLLDNLAVPSEARMRSICSPDLAPLASRPGWPASQAVLLQLRKRRRKNRRLSTCRGKRGGEESLQQSRTSFWDLEVPVGNWYNLERSFQRGKQAGDL